MGDPNLRNFAGVLNGNPLKSRGVGGGGVVVHAYPAGIGQMKERTILISVITKVMRNQHFGSIYAMKEPYM